MKKNLSAFLFLVIFLYLLPNPAVAGYCSDGQCLPGPPAPGFRGCTSDQQCLSAINFGLIQQALPGFNFADKTLGDIIKEVIPYLFGAAGLILLLYLIWGGFSLMLSKGDQKAVEAARGRITTAITGFIIIFVAYWLVQILGLILGIEQFGQIFK